MIAALASALLFFFAHLHPLEAEHMATVIAEEAYFANIDPVTLAARGWCESGFRPRTLHAGTYGAWQCRERAVTVRTQAACGARALAWWRDYHLAGKCRQEPAHGFTLHYTWGAVVPRARRVADGLKIWRVARLLEARMASYAPQPRPLRVRGRAGPARLVVGHLLIAAHGAGDGILVAGLLRAVFVGGTSEVTFGAVELRGRLCVFLHVVFLVGGVCRCVHELDNSSTPLTVNGLKQHFSN